MYPQPSPSAPLLVQKDDLIAAVEAGVLQPEQLDGLATFLTHRYAVSPRAETAAAQCSSTTVLYYIGGALGIGAAAAFGELMTEQLGPNGVLAMCCVYAAAAGGIAEFFRQKRMSVPASIFAVICTVMTSVTVWMFFLTHGTLIHNHVLRRFIVWTAGLAAGVLLLTRFQYPFLVLPVACYVHAIVVDALPHLIFDMRGGWSEEIEDKRMMLVFALGCLTLFVALLVDLKTIHKRDFSFWLYLAGLNAYIIPLWHFGAFKGCYTDWRVHTLRTARVVPQLAAFFMHTLLVPVGAMLSRRIIVLVGAVGMFGGVMNIAVCYVPAGVWTVIALTALALAFVGTGAVWNHHELRISRALRTVLPDKIRELGDSRNGW